MLCRPLLHGCLQPLRFPIFVLTRPLSLSVFVCWYNCLLVRPASSPCICPPSLRAPAFLVDRTLPVLPVNPRACSLYLPGGQCFHFRVVYVRSASADLIYFASFSVLVLVRCVFASQFFTACVLRVSASVLCRPVCMRRFRSLPFGLFDKSARLQLPANLSVYFYAPMQSVPLLSSTFSTHALSLVARVLSLSPVCAPSCIYLLAFISLSIR